MSNVVKLHTTPLKSRKPETFTIEIFDHEIPLLLSRANAFFDLYCDKEALAYLDAIPPVQRAWVYRELGA